MQYHFLIIGGGILGISTAWQLQQRYPDKKVLVLEKEDRLARHQTGHNSGVIHAGVYYQPGSLKVKFCKLGVKATIGFCKEHHLPFEQCGKLLVATDQFETKRMEGLMQRCRQNGIDAERLDRDQLAESEPNVNGVGALFVRTTGIVDYKQVCRKMAECFREYGGSLILNAEVVDILENDKGLEVVTTDGRYNCDYLISCAGMMADRITRMHGLAAEFQIIPFRGEYYRLAPDKSEMIRHLIYPIPDPSLPFLGVHLTRMIDGSITVGPNAVLGWKREGYGRVNFSLPDTWQMLRFRGFWKVLQNNLGSGLDEMKNSWWKRGYLKRVRKYCPQLTAEDLLPYPAGIRAQAVLCDGTLVHDFLFSESPRGLHVCNAPSPAATSAIPIGGHICDRIAGKIS
ncbi:MAG: L-2-hydroxyglutarate oxidase [Gammaproteobacteria bacterium]